MPPATENLISLNTKIVQEIYRSISPEVGSVGEFKLLQTRATGSNTGRQSRNQDPQCKDVGNDGTGMEFDASGHAEGSGGQQSGYRATMRHVMSKLDGQSQRVIMSLMMSGPTTGEEHDYQVLEETTIDYNPPAHLSPYFWKAIEILQAVGCDNLYVKPSVEDWLNGVN